MSDELKGKAVKQLRLPTVDYSYSPAKYFNAQGGDTNARYIEVQLFDDRGTIDLSPYTIDTTLWTTLPDGRKEVSTGTLDIENNKARYKILSGMLSQIGTVSCSAHFLGTDEKTGETISLTSQTFYIVVLESQNTNKAVSSNNSYNLLVQLLAELDLYRDAEKQRQINELGENLDGKGGRVGAEAERQEFFEEITSLPANVQIQEGDDYYTVEGLVFVKVEDDMQDNV